MTILLASIPTIGHFNPILVATGTLEDADHKTAIYTTIVFRNTIERAGIRWFCLLGMPIWVCLTSVHLFVKSIR